MNKNINIIFMGTPEFSVNALDILIKNYNVVLVVTQPDKIVGRKKVIEYSPVKKLALENNIEVFQPISIKKDYQKILDTEADFIITCAYGQIVPDVVLNHSKYPAINIHASLLPKLRGAAPINYALLNGDSKTGITIMYMNDKMDEGDILFKKECLIDIDDNYKTLHDKLSLLGSETINEVIPKIINNEIVVTKQNHEEATYTKLIKREDEKLLFNDTTINIYNKIRAFSPIPCAYFVMDSFEVKVYNAYIKENNSNKDVGTITNIYKDGIGIKTLDGEIVITKIKVQGKKEMLVRDYINGINKEKLMNKKVE